MPRKTLTPAVPTTLPIAISYVRFSNPDQAGGDSLRRQTEDTERWCERNGMKLNTSLSIRDLGVSAFKGKHRDEKAALGQFLEAVKQGTVPRGSFLIIENLDRLSREEERTALRLWLDILDHGINIVQLHPETVFRHERSDMTDIIRAIIELSRGHSESRMKSQRILAAWAHKRKETREAGQLLTRRLPAWVEEKDGRLQLVPDRAAVVKRIFQLSAGGYGNTSIIKQLTADNVPAFGAREAGENGRHKGKAGVPFGCGEWRRSYVSEILRDRRAVGEFQPRTADGKPDGAPLVGYYPPAVTEAEFFAARAGAAGRKQKQGRIGNGVANVFGGLLRNARDGGTYYAGTRNDDGKVSKVLINRGATEGKGPYWTFPYSTFERAILSALVEIDPADVLGRGDSPADVAVLQGELAWVRERKSALEAELLNGDLSTIANALRQLEAREAELAAKLDDAEERTVKPLGETWRDAKSLAEMLDSAPDPEDVRLRLRAALRRVVDAIWVLVVPRGRDRLCEAQIWFAGGEHYRSYSIIHRPARSNGKARTPGRWWWNSIKHPEAARVGLPFNMEDLRDSTDVECVRLYLENLSAANIDWLLSMGEDIE